MSGIVLAEGVVEVTADAKGIPREIAQQVQGDESATKGAGLSVGKSIFGGIVGGFAAIGGAKIVTDFFTGAITGASDLNETISKSSTIFGSSAGAVESWASGAAQAVGLSKSAALDAAAGFGNMFTQLGFGADAAAAMSQKTVQMAADLGSFNNVPTADVADSISAAFRGEYDSLQALIPNINAARVEQEALSMTGKTSVDQLTAQEKAQAVLSIVQRDGAAAMGDYARTADGAANTQKTLTASLEDQQSKLGQTLMPLWQGFLGFLTDTAIPVLSTIVTWISQNASWLGPLALALGIVTGAVWAFNIALNANPIMLIITALALLVGGILWVATQTTFFQDVWTGVMNVVGSVATWFGDVFRNVVNGVGAAFNWVWNSVIRPVGDFISGAFRAIGDAVHSVFSGIGDFIGGVFRNIVNVIKGPINTVIGFLNQAIDGANIVGGAFGVSIPHIPMLAKGGTITGSGSVMVGERGPEILNLPRGASVVPLDHPSAKSSGATPIVNVNQTVMATDPIIGSRQAAREVARYLGVS